MGGLTSAQTKPPQPPSLPPCCSSLLRLGPLPSFPWLLLLRLFLVFFFDWSPSSSSPSSTSSSPSSLLPVAL